MNLDEQTTLASVKVEAGIMSHMFNMMNSHCFRSCIESITTEDLTIRETVCLDHCVQKYCESFSLSKLRMQRFSDEQSEKLALENKMKSLMGGQR